MPAWQPDAVIVGMKTAKRQSVTAVAEFLEPIPNVHHKEATRETVNSSPGTTGSAAAAVARLRRRIQSQRGQAGRRGGRSTGYEAFPFASLDEKDYLLSSRRVPAAAPR